jgi:hypothetical protein
LSSLWWENLGKGCRNVGISGQKTGGILQDRKLRALQGSVFGSCKNMGNGKRPKMQLLAFSNCEGKIRMEMGHRYSLVMLIMQLMLNIILNIL